MLASPSIFICRVISILDVTYDVIGNPHYPYVIVGLGLELVLQLEAGAHLYDVIMTS